MTSAITALGVSIAFAAGCSSGNSIGATSGSSCPDEAPQVCPPNIPSYATSVAPIIGEYCASGCHMPGGTAGAFETTYADVYGQRGSILSVVNGCMMPPSSARALTSQQREIILTWLVCGAPNN
jgi:hypothetical protein